MSARLIQFPIPAPRTPEHLREVAIQDAVWSLVNYFGRGDDAGRISSDDLLLHLDGMGWPEDVAREAAERWRTW